MTKEKAAAHRARARREVNRVGRTYASDGNGVRHMSDDELARIAASRPVVADQGVIDAEGELRRRANKE